MNPHALEAGVPYLAWAKWKSMHFMGVFIQQTGNLLDNTWPPIFFSLECRKMFYLSHETCLATGKLQKMDTMSLWKLPFLYRIKKGVYLVVWYLWDNAKFQSFRVTVLFIVCRRGNKPACVYFTKTGPKIRRRTILLEKTGLLAVGQGRWGSDALGTYNFVQNLEALDSVSIIMCSILSI